MFGDAVFAVLVASSVAWGLASIGHYKGWWDISSYLGENYDRDGLSRSPSSCIWPQRPAWSRAVPRPRPREGEASLAGTTLPVVTRPFDAFDAARPIRDA